MKSDPLFKPGHFYSIGYNRDQALMSVGTGWASLVNEIFDKIEHSEIPIIVDQVKEKWGGLRVYTTPYIEEFEKFLTDLEKKSFTVCEVCGQTAKLRTGNWYRTRCDEHADGQPSINPF